MEEQKKYNIIYFSNIEWNFVYQRHQQMTNTFAKKDCIDNIIFVETLGGRQVKLNKNDLLRILKRLKKIFLKDKSNINKNPIENKVKILTPTVIPIYNFFVYKINEILLNYQLTKKIKELNIDLNNTIAIINLSHPVIYNLLKKKKFKKIIFDYIDDTKSMPNIHKDILKYEDEFIKDADLVFVTSQSLLQNSLKLNKSSKLLPNAVPASLIQNDITITKNESENIVGYIGAIYEWFDLDILYKCAEKYSDVKFEIVGPVRVNTDKFNKLNNVEFKGLIPYNEVENYIKKFSVCIIPFILNDLILHTNPVKVYEYFAKGKPVVTTALPELNKYKDYLYLSNNEEEFIKNVRIALSENDKQLEQTRIEIAKNNTWDARVNEAIKLILEEN